MGEDGFSLEVSIPANVRATVRLPDASLAQVTEGGQPLANAAGVTRVEQDSDTVIVEVGSGQYRFAYPAENLFAGLLAARRLNSHTSLKKLHSSEAAWKVLNEHLPEMANVPEVWMDRIIAQGSTLRQLAQFAMSNLTPERLDALDEALAQL